MVALLRVFLGLAHSCTWLIIQVPPPHGNCSEEPGPTTQEVDTTTQAWTSKKGKEGARWGSAACPPSPLLAPGPELPLEGWCPGDASIRGRAGRGWEEAMTRDKRGRRTVSPSLGWHREGRQWPPEDGEPDRIASAGQGDLPHWHWVPYGPITPTSLLV